MRKVLILVTAFLIPFMLVACDQNGTDLLAPTFESVVVEGLAPTTDGEFITFYEGKSTEILVEVMIDNPSSLPIKSIVINGYTHSSVRFVDGSTPSRVAFYMNVGDELGETIYSVDRINYLAGEKTLSVNVERNNEFKVYVFKDSPNVTRENYGLTQNKISIDFTINDIDNVIVPNSLKAYLFTGENMVDEKLITSGSVNVTFDGLISNRLYEVRIIADYDLDDGLGLRDNQVLYSGTYSTLANGLPSASIENVVVDSNRVDFDVSFNDSDNVLVPGGLTVGLFIDDEMIDSLQISGSMTNLSFEELLNDNTYVIKILVDFDLRDGLGIREGNTLASHSFTTLPISVPKPTLLDLDLQENSIEFNVFIDDPEEVIDKTSLYAKLYIDDVYEGIADLVDYHVDFQVNNLFASNTLKIEIIGNYDLNDGQGLREDQILLTRELDTTLNNPPVVYVESLSVTQGYVSLLLDVTDINDTLIGSISAVLYEGDVAVQTIQIGPETNELVFDYPTTFETSYYIDFYADYNLRDNQGLKVNQLLRHVVFYTAEKKEPIAEIRNLVKDSESMTMNVRIVDADGTIQDNSTIVRLYHEGSVVAEQNLTIGENDVTFDNLYSNNEYEIKIYTNYDLDDMSGVLTDVILLKTSLLTEPKQLPNSDFIYEELGKTNVVFDLSVIDNDQVIVDGTINATLYFEGLEVASQVLINGDNFAVTFNNLYSDSNYKIVVTADYDLNDNQGVISDFILGETSIRTEAKQVLSADIPFIETDDTSITFDVVVDDADQTLVSNLKAILLLNDTPTGDEIPLQVGYNSSLKFDNLYSNQRYYIFIYADYDLNDTEGVHNTELITTDFTKTKSKTGIYGFISNVVPATNQVTFDVEISDPSQIITGGLRAEIYDISNQSTGLFANLTVGDNNLVTITGLSSSTDYIVKVLASYDSNEISGPITDEVLDTLSFTTDTLSAPTANINDVVTGETTIDTTIEVTDEDNVITGSLKAIIKQSGTIVDEIVLSVGTNAIQFTGLYTGTEYEIVVVTDYDLNDGSGLVSAVELAKTTVSTISRNVPEVTISDLTITATTVSFKYDLNDVDNVMTAGTVKAHLKVGGVTIASQSLSTNTVQFDLSGFVSDFAFEIVLTGDYDLGDMNGFQDDGIIKTLSLRTEAKEVPSAVISNVSIHQLSVDMTVNITDNDEVITGNLEAILYDQAGLVLSTVGLQAGTNEVSFPVTITKETTYRVEIQADYDLLDAAGTHSDKLLAEQVIYTHNDLRPEGYISNVVVGEESISIDINLVDTYSTITGTSYARIYLEGTLVSETTIVLGNNVGVSFSGLTSGKEYEIRVETSYDNGDGNGIYSNATIGAITKPTDVKEEASASISVSDIQDDQITWDISIVDNSSVTTVRNANLYDENGTLIDTIALSVGANSVTFTSLTMTSIYEIRVEISYDLNDGNGIQTSTLVTDTQTTETNVEPSGSIDSTNATTGSITVSATLVDDSSIVSAANLNLYDSTGSLVSQIAITVGSNTETFVGLTPSQTYTVKLVVDYDMHDGSGAVSDVVLATQSQDTNKLIYITMNNNDIDANNKGRHEIDVEVQDVDSILQNSLLTATLYENGVAKVTYIVTKDAVTNIQMINLLNDYDYTLEITGTFDSGAGSVTEVIERYEFTTLALTKPDVTISLFETWTLTPNVSFSLTVGTDSNNVASDTDWFAYLYVDGTLVDTVDIDAILGVNPEGTTNTITFTGYTTTGTEAYTILITSLVDMHDEPGSSAVETGLASATGIDAGN